MIFSSTSRLSTVRAEIVLGQPRGLDPADIRKVDRAVRLDAAVQSRIGWSGILIATTSDVVSNARHPAPPEPPSPQEASGKIARMSAIRIFGSPSLAPGTRLG